MDSSVYILVAVVIGLAVGAWLGTRLGRAKGGGTAAQKAAAEEAERIRDAARAEIEAIKKSAEVEGKELWVSIAGVAVQNLKAQMSHLPEQPGVYLFGNGAGETIYIGKARSLRDRVRSYLGARGLHPKTDALLDEADAAAD